MVKNREQFGLYGDNILSRRRNVMIKRALCSQCGRVQPVEVVTREENYTYRGESVTLTHELTKCTVCGAELSTAEQAEQSLTAIRESYRRTHNIVTPEEIRSIRNRYGAGQKPFGILLGLGKSTINTYEQGEVPTVANSMLIRAAEDPEYFKRMYIERRHLIGQTQRRRIEQHLSSPVSAYVPAVETFTLHENTDEYTGFRKPDIQRIEQLIGHIAVHAGEVYKTKLLKIAFLIDYEHFKTHTVGVSGWQYARLPYGPVPQDYKLVLEKSERDGYIETQDYDDGTSTVKAGKSSTKLLKEAHFSDNELETINRVINGWKNATAQEL